MSQKNIISVKNLVKKFDDFTAVKNISFDVKEGEIFGILGPNGAGKTTTLEILETLQTPTSGEVEIDGLPLLQNTQKIKELIGVQFQSGAFYPKLNLEQLIHMFAGLYEVENVNTQTMLEEWDLYEKRKTEFKYLSGGQKQRFAILIATINKPKIIFLDEPSTGLDPQARRNLWKKIKDINAQGITIVITSHFMDEAEVLCDRISIMNRGEIVKLDTPQQLIDDLLASGFKKEIAHKEANLEDVFLELTGTELIG